VLVGVDGELSVPVHVGPEAEGAVAADLAAAATLVGIAPSAAAGMPARTVLGIFTPAEPLAPASLLAL
jgi:hypothetical protein